MPKRLKSGLVLCNVPTTKSEEARRFYSSLLGLDDFVRAPNEEVESYFHPISADGIDMTITQRYDDQERLTCYFAVDDLDATLRELESLGGRIEVQPREVTMSERAREAIKRASRGRAPRANVGRMAVVLDPDLNHLGLIQLDSSAHRHFRWGRFKRGIDNDQVAGVKEARKVAEETFG
jgi:predicted enzyme related to lactoylglutathione lyase